MLRQVPSALTLRRAAVLALSTTTATLAQSPNRAGTAPPTASNAVGQPEMVISRTAGPPVIDGHLDDPMWNTALRIDRFPQSSPTEGGAPTERTDVWIACDENQLYFGFHAHYSDPTIIRANRVDRDRAGRDDWIAVMFDPFRDQQRAYRFSVNGYGVQGDAILNAGGSTRGPPGGGGDTTWNALFDSTGQLVADGWTAELAIPFKSLGYPTRPSGQPHQWGFQIARTIQTKDETLVWAPYTRNLTGLPHQMGLLVGMDNVSPSRNIELLPTVTAIQYGELDRATGQFANASPTPDIGLNLKYGVTSNLTADFTANPDYSQVEVSQRFPLYFPQFRPFFLEGQEIFNTPGSLNLLHTRTIVDPRIGGKLTGKVGRTTLGVLVAYDETPGKRGDPDGDAFGRTAQLFIGRTRYDLYSESHIGAIVTDREFIDSLAGVDGRLQVGRSHP